MLILQHLNVEDTVKYPAFLPFMLSSNKSKAWNTDNKHMLLPTSKVVLLVICSVPQDFLVYKVLMKGILI